MKESIKVLRENIVLFSETYCDHYNIAGIAKKSLVNANRMLFDKIIEKSYEVE